MQAYTPARRDYARGIIHGIQEADPAKLLKLITCPTQRVLSARPLEKKGTVLVSFDGPAPPKQVFCYEVLEKKVFEYKPKVVICTQCHDIGHKYDICPNQHRIRCAKCGGPQHESETCPADKAVCKNCKGPHLATDQRCPARQQAN